MFRISFDFDEHSCKLSNIKIININVSKTDSDVIVNDNKLSLSESLINKLSASPGDRISINYWNASSTETYPIISKAEVFTDGADGSKLTKSNTISYRGQQRETLLKFGNQFNVEEFIDKQGEVKPDVFKLIPIDKEEGVLNEEEKLLNNTENKVIEDSLAEIFNDEDVLPF